MTAKILNFGSINIDHVYQVPHFVQPGETLPSTQLTTGLGGKGANQSVAIAKAGMAVSHVGRVSKTDHWAVEMMSSAGVDMTNTKIVEEPSGHAIIQVDDNGENAIVLHGGANQGFTRQKLEDIFVSNRDADMLLLQNETNLIEDAIELARTLNIKIAFNPAPMTSEISELPLQYIDTLIVNRGEAEILTNQIKVDDIVSQLVSRFPLTKVVLTLGENGAMLIDSSSVIHVNSPKVEVVDTTCAGDTFVGYFLAGLTNRLEYLDALNQACYAAALAVTKSGAIASIPNLDEVTAFLSN